MRSWLPYPTLSAALLATWVMLQQSLSVGNVLLGILFGIVGGRIMSVLRPPLARPRSLSPVLRLAAMVPWDVIQSNIAVARIILRDTGRRRPGFVEIPLALQHPTGLTILACIITATPGTLWVDYDAKAGILTIHVLDLMEEGHWIRLIKSRYERPLLEMFG